MNPYARPPLAPVSQTRRYSTPVYKPKTLHGTMSNSEAFKKRSLFRGNFVAKKSQVKATNRRNSSSNENYGNVYSVPINFKIPVGNLNTRKTLPGTAEYNRQQALSNTALYNLFDRPRHKAALNNYFKKQNFFYNSSSNENKGKGKGKGTKRFRKNNRA